MARHVAAELVALAAATLWVYGGCALVVAAFGDGASLSFGAAAAVVVLSYGLARGLSQLDLSDRALRLWGSVLSIALFYIVLRCEIAGDASVWKLGWVIDLVTQPGDTLQGHGGDVAAVVVLGAAWLRGVLRGASDLTFESTLSDVSLGMVAVLLAVAFASSADAPPALRWLPVPFMVTALLALALAHLRSVETDQSRAFLGAWALSTGGFLALVAGLAVLASMYHRPSVGAIGEELSVAGRDVATAVVVIISPVLIGVAWTMERLVGWMSNGHNLVPQLPDTRGLTRQQQQETHPSHWAIVLGYVLGSSLVVLIVAAALALLWFSFRRLSRRREDEPEERVGVERGPGFGRPNEASLLARALQRLRRPSRGRDAIGRLYLSVLRSAAAQGLERPASSTPLEFAGALERHFGSPVVGAISRAYAEARYGRRGPANDELEQLRAAWQQLARD